MKTALLSLILCLANYTWAQNNITISGYLRNPLNKEVLLFAKVFVVEANKGVTTNEYGFFSIQVPEAEKYTLLLFLLNLKLLRSK